MNNQNNGWIKLYRQMTDWCWYKDTNTKVVFLHLLMMASYEKHKFRGYTIKPGQVVTGRKKLAEDLGLSESTIRTAINHLKLTNEITIKTTNKFSIITIENWTKYQGGLDDSDQQNNQHHDQQLTSKTQNFNHIQEIKKVKNKGGTPKLSSKAKKLNDTYNMLEEWANEEK